MLRVSRVRAVPSQAGTQNPHIDTHMHIMRQSGGDSVVPVHGRRQQESHVLRCCAYSIPYGAVISALRIFTWVRPTPTFYSKFYSKW